MTLCACGFSDYTYVVTVKRVALALVDLDDPVGPQQFPGSEYRLRTAVLTETLNIGTHYHSGLLGRECLVWLTLDLN